MKKLLLVFMFTVLVFFTDSREALADSSHTHSDSCYDGTKHAHQGDSSTQSGCYTGAGTPVYGACGGYCSSWTQYYCKDCTSYFAGGSTCGQCGSSNTNSWSNYSCSTCGYSGFSSGHNSVIKGYTYELGCGKTEGLYYNGDTLVSNTCCDTVVTGLTPNQTTQTLYPNSSVDVSAVASYLDGHTETVDCTLSDFTDDISQNGITQTATLSYGNKSTTATNNVAYTTQISLTKYFYVPCNVESASTIKGTVDVSGVPFVNVTGFENCCTPNDSFTVIAIPNSGYQFKGWYNSSDDTLISTSTTYSGTIPTSGLDIYADFEAITLNITFNANGGSSVNNVTVCYESSYGNLPTPSKSGYDFNGWYLENSFSALITSSSVVNTKNNHTLYAKWTLIPQPPVEEKESNEESEENTDEKEVDIPTEETSGSAENNSESQSDNDYDYMEDILNEIDENTFSITYPEKDNSINDEEYNNLWNTLEEKYNVVNGLKNDYDNLKNEITEKIELLNSDNELSEEELKELEELLIILIDEINALSEQIVILSDEYNALYNEFINYTSSITGESEVDVENENSDTEAETNNDNEMDNETSSTTPDEQDSNDSENKSNNSVGKWILTIGGIIVGAGGIVFLIIFIKQRKYKY